ncbi:MAG: ATP-binding protein [Terrimicrobiaceae bacterium]|nr:ATP-binding protein [Terrimicrobiaceae bacterium]
MVTLHFKNDLAELDRLAGEIRAFGRRHHLDSASSHAILLAMDELLTNVISHGMPGQPRPVIEVRMDVEAGDFTGELRDNGRAFDPGTAPAPDLEIPIADREPGGLGIFLARSKMDRLEYRREDGWNIVNLRTKL